MMSASPASRLLSILDTGSERSVVTDAQANRAVQDVIDHLKSVETTQKKQKAWQETYLVERVFSRTRKFTTEHEETNWLRCHLRVGLTQFENLVASLRTDNSGTLSLAQLDQWKDVFVDYVYDFNTVVTPLVQRSVPDYHFIKGGKNRTVHSWEVFRLAQHLHYMSPFWGHGSGPEHKNSQIAAIGVLRQSLELRFDRLVGVYPLDKKGKSPKLRHGFHQDFVVKNPQFFQPQNFSISELKPMYDWCSEIVHQAYQPFAWQISWAIELAGRLMNPRQPMSGGAWSIDNAVHVMDVREMQTAFEDHFLASYDHGQWKFAKIRPEALVAGWKPEMATVSADFRSPTNGQRREKNCWRKLARSLRRPTTRRSRGAG